MQRPDVFPVSELVVDRDRPQDRGERVLEPADGVCRARQLLEHGRQLGCRQPIAEGRGASIERVGLAVGLHPRRSTRRDDRVVADDLLRARRLRMVDDVRRVGVRGEQGFQDLGVETPPGGGRDARPDRVPRELVAETDVRRADLEQLSSLGLDRGLGPARHDFVQQARAQAARNDGDELDQVARGIVEPRGASEHGVRDRPRQVDRRLGAEQLGDVERIPPGGGVHLVRALSDERRHRALRQRR